MSRYQIPVALTRLPNYIMWTLSFLPPKWRGTVTEFREDHHLHDQSYVEGTDVDLVFQKMAEMALLIYERRSAIKRQSIRSQSEFCGGVDG